MHILQFLLCVLSCYAISLFVSKLQGPGHVFSKLRKAAKSQLVSCPICLGTWIAFAITTYSYFFLELPLQFTPIYAFGIAGANALIHLTDPVE